MTAGRLTLDAQLCFALFAATNAVIRSYDPKLNRLGLTYRQYLVMLALWQDGPGGLSRLSARLGLGTSETVELVDELALAGLVAPERLENGDAEVRLTDAGRALEPETFLVQQTVVCETGLAPDDLADLRDRLHEMVRTMEGPEAPRTEEG